MIHAKFQDNGTASSGVDDFKGILLYMDMAAILGM